MPFRSRSQRRFAYAHPEKFGGKKGLKHWESVTPKGIPEKVGKAELEKGGNVYDFNSPNSEYEIKEEPQRFDYGLGKNGRTLNVYGLYHKPTGERVGQHIYYSLYKPKESDEKGTSVYTHHTTSIEVDPAHRRKGLANAMYRYAEQSGPFDRMARTKIRTEDGKALWSQPNRPFGKAESTVGHFDMGHCGTYALALHDLTNGKARLGMIRGEKSSEDGDDFCPDINVHSFVFHPHDPSKGVGVHGPFDIERRANEWENENGHLDPYYDVEEHSRDSFLKALKDTWHPKIEDEYGKAVDHIKSSGVLNLFKEGSMSKAELGKVGKAELEKGAKGDWKKEGYSIQSSSPDEDGCIEVTAHHPNRKYIGLAIFSPSETAGYVYPYMVKIHPDHQRKGLATAMYQHAEKALGLKIKPSDDQSEDAEALWSQPNRPFGKAEEGPVPPHLLYRETVPTPKNQQRIDHIKKVAQEHGYKHIGTNHSQTTSSKYLKFKNPSLRPKDPWGKEYEADPIFIRVSDHPPSRGAGGFDFSSDPYQDLMTEKYPEWTAENVFRKHKEGYLQRMGKSELAKGSRQARIPYNPLKDVHADVNGEPQYDRIGQAERIRSWQESEGKTPRRQRDLITKDTGNIRERFLHKLARATSVRRASDGGVEYLLHRGESGTRVVPNRKTDDTHVDHPYATSWTPNYGVAKGFADQYKGVDPELHSAWIHEKNILTVPKQYGYAGLGRKNRFANEHEVIVAPDHHSERANYKHIEPYEPHPDLQERINRRRGILGISQSPRAVLQNRRFNKSELAKALTPDEMKAQGYKFKILKPTQRREAYAVTAHHNGKKIGHLLFSRSPRMGSREDKAHEKGFYEVHTAEIEPEHRNKGLYQQMLNIGADHAKSMGGEGLMSEGYQRSPDATRAWNKVASFAHDPGESSSIKPLPYRANFFLRKTELAKRCWAGYAPVKGKKPYSKGSCAPIKKVEELKKARDNESLKKRLEGFKKIRKL